MNQISSTSESGDIGSSNCRADFSVAPYVSVAEGYERWAPTYDQAPNPLLNLEERKLAAHLPDLSGRHVLDLACGTGRWLEKLTGRGAGVGIGVDLSAAMLRVAGKKAAIAGRLAQADCLALPFRSEVFDLVVCSFALGHIRDLGAMVRELARVMKAGADVFVSDLHPEAYARGWRTGFRDSRSAMQIEMLPRTAEEIIRAFYSGGFECLTHLPLCLGEPEKPIFARAGKSHLFTRACQLPAVLVCQFRRTSAETRLRGGR
ncbi:MAG TPA: methyltransferase domain-containing protein [Terriglobales bacterium]|nr:methyltransferase domain-containing protein [Terriglobales bacterium]